MALEPIRSLIGRAVAGGYAVGYFESWSLESLQGVIDAAEAARAPVVIGFNGDFLSRPDRRAAERLALYAALGRAAAESADVPCSLIFNECPDDAWVRTAIELGFNLVMPTPRAKDAREYRDRVAAIVRIAHSRNVGVEGELGELPCGASGEIVGEGAMTDPGEAAAFVAAAGIDLLAVSVGNIHIRVRGEAGLDLDRLAAIHRQAGVPLVLHGGTGISAEAIRGAIERGVAKVNYGTYLKQRYLRAVRAALARDEIDPHRLLGLGGPDDVLVAGRMAVRDAVLERIDVLGCRGRA